MLALLSPSKALAEVGDVKAVASSTPVLLEQSQELVSILKRYSEQELGDLMGISKKLAALNAQRYADFTTPFNKDNAAAAILLFQGDVYDGLAAEDFSEAELARANDNIAILSGLYGLLRPLDLMQPYRLEMGTKLANDGGKNLYEFWGEGITDEINAREGELVVNLASQEYFKAVHTDKLKAKLVTVNFKERKGDGYKIIGLFAKKARGMMARFIVTQKCDTLESLKAFDDEGYAFNASQSSDDELIFTRG